MIDRRRLVLGLGVLAGAAALSGCGVGQEIPSADPDREAEKIDYGSEHPDQHAFLGLPTDTDPRALVVLLHGGYWLDQFGADLMEPLAADLRQRGLATWNVEYRRLGSGGGWPTTFLDVAAALDFLGDVAEVDGLPVHVVGHSAGGHLAGWAASRSGSTPGGAPAVRPIATYPLSGVLDLRAAAAEGLGNGASLELLGGTPREHPDRYRQGDPTLLVPGTGKVTAFHAVDDELVPLSQSRSYVDAAVQAGGDASLVQVPGGHFDLIDPTSAAWERVVQSLP